jgi:tetratricopeptide (TPR) repeat protein
MKKSAAIAAMLILCIGCSGPNYAMKVSMLQDSISGTDYNSAKADIMALITEYPEKPEPYYFLGIINFDAEKYRDCLSNFYEAERRNFEPTPDYSLKKGIALYHTGSIAEAENELTNYPSIARSEAAQKYLGLILFDRKDYKGSAAAFGKAASLSGDRTALYKFGMALYFEGRNSEALDILSRAVNLPRVNDSDGINDSLLFHTANLLLLEGRAEEAVRLYTRIPDNSPFAPESIYNSAEAFIVSGQLDTAAKLLENYLVLRPDDTEAKVNLSSILIQTGEYVAAAYILSNIAETGYRPDALYNYGLANHMLGKYAESVYYLAKATALVPDNTEYRYAYGITLTEYGDIEQARIQMEAAAALDPGNTDAEEWLNRHLPVE